MKSKRYTLKYKTVVEGGKSKTITKLYANLKEARKEGRMYFDSFISLKNEKGVSLTL
jgi:hypothetical protein